MRLLAGQGGVVGALLCASDFWHPRHSTVPCIMQNTSVFRMSAMDVEANSLPQGLEPPAKPPAKPAPKAAKPHVNPSTKSAAKPAAKVAAMPAAQPAAGEPIPVAPVEHVQLSRVKYSRQKKWHTEFLSSF